MKIYIQRGSEQFGPYSREDATSYVNQGVLILNDWAWREGLGEWRPLQELLSAISNSGIASPIYQREPNTPLPERPSIRQMLSSWSKKVFGFMSKVLPFTSIFLFIGGPLLLGGLVVKKQQTLDLRRLPFSEPILRKCHLLDQTQEVEKQLIETQRTLPVDERMLRMAKIDLEQAENDESKNSANLSIEKYEQRVADLKTKIDTLARQLYAKKTAINKAANKILAAGLLFFLGGAIPISIDILSKKKIESELSTIAISSKRSKLASSKDASKKLWRRSKKKTPAPQTSESV